MGGIAGNKLTGLYGPGLQNSRTSNADQAKLDQYERMFQTGQGYGNNDKEAVAYKAFRETNGRPPTIAELGNALGTSEQGLDSYALSGARPTLEAEGQRQFADANNFINQDQITRAGGRQALSEALTKQGQDIFKQGLPGTLEDLNARHLLNGSGVGQEIARQQGNLATNITDQLGTVGANDIDLASQQRAAALQGLQSFQTGGLQRQFGLQDFANQAKLARDIGSGAVPSVGKGGGTGALQGAASGAAAGAPFGHWGAPIGAATGAIYGGLSKRSGGGK